MAKFSERLSEELACRNMRPVHLAARTADMGAEISLWSIERWMTGKGEPSISRARIVADALGISLDDLCPANVEVV